MGRLVCGHTVGSGLPINGTRSGYAAASTIYAAALGGLNIGVPVPEPSTYALALAGLACGGDARRRRPDASRAIPTTTRGGRAPRGPAPFGRFWAGARAGLKVCER